MSLVGHSSCRCVTVVVWCGDSKSELDLYFLLPPSTLNIGFQTTSFTSIATSHHHNLEPKATHTTHIHTNTHPHTHTHTQRHMPVIYGRYFGDVKFEFGSQEELEMFTRRYLLNKYLFGPNGERRIAGSKRVERYQREHGHSKGSEQGPLLESVKAHPALSTGSFEVCAFYICKLFSPCLTSRHFF